MKLLVLAQHIGRTASGKVFEKIVSNISETNEVTLVTMNFCPSPDIKLDKISKLVRIKEPQFINYRFTFHLNRLFSKFCGISWVDYCSRKKMAAVCPHDFDAVLALCSRPYLAPLENGLRIRKDLGIPLSVYLVDPIPTPPWWTTGRANRIGGERFFRQSEFIDMLGCTNPIVADYQRRHSHPRCSNIQVIYLPGREKMLSIPPAPADGIPRFLYTGTIYGARKPDYLFGAFRRLAESYPDAELHFVGTGRQILKACPAEIKKNIRFHDFADDLTPFYQMATALIDIDAAVDYEVFQSSKLSDYLSVPRPIICETGTTSPAHLIADKSRSIIATPHSSDRIYEAMLRAIREPFDFADRGQLISEMSVSAVSETLSNHIKATI